MSLHHFSMYRRVLLVLALLVGASAFSFLFLNGAAAQEGVSPSALRPNGKIAFVSQYLYTVGSDGSAPAKLIDSQTEIRYPAWSPDASKIAFSRNVFPVQNLDIFVANADGSNIVRLTNAGNAPTGTNTNYGATWSPDGAKIAFASSRSGNSDIWVMNADGSNPVNLTANTSASDLDPAWSPDGSKIAFASQRDFPNITVYDSVCIEIYTMNPDGSNVSRLTNNQTLDLEPAWSPSGGTLLFIRRVTNAQSGAQDNDIFKMNADGTAQTNITNNPSYDFDPCWSPDGTRIAFATFRDAVQNSNSEIYIMDADGSFPTRITNSPGNEEREPDWGTVSPNSTPTPTPTATPTPTPLPVYNITGRVTDGGGNGVSGVTVMLITARNGSRATLTKADGSFQHYYTADTRITLSCAKDGYAFSPSNLSFVSSGSITGDKPDTNFTALPYPFPSTFAFSAPTYSVSEGATSATITVTRGGGVNALVSGAVVSYRTVDDQAAVRCDTVGATAYARCDYATGIDTLYFAGSETEKTFTISIINDAHVENTESVALELFNPIGATLATPSTATLNITDNDVSGTANPVDDSRVFVRQQYLDFLAREPESAGFSAWLGVLNNCSDVNNNPACDRNTVASSFFRSTEFQLKGYFVYRFYTLVLMRTPHYAEIIPDMKSVSGSTAAEVFAKRAAYTDAWAQRPAFKTMFDTKTDPEFVNILMDRRGLSQITTPDPANPEGTAKVTLTRADLITRLNAATLTRAQAVRAIIESDEVFNAEYNPAFVAMQYFGFLRRDPDPDYNAWLAYLNAHPTEYRTMVNGFMNSYEYRLRFGQP